jgi:hypothetical protein
LHRPIPLARPSAAIPARRARRCFWRIADNLFGYVLILRRPFWRQDRTPIYKPASDHGLRPIGDMRWGKRCRSVGSIDWSICSQKHAPAGIFRYRTFPSESAGSRQELRPHGRWVQRRTFLAAHELVRRTRMLPKRAREPEEIAPRPDAQSPCPFPCTSLSVFRRGQACWWDREWLSEIVVSRRDLGFWRAGEVE